MKQRNTELDFLKGIAIFLMMFDHVGWGSVAHVYIQSFHMPLFFIVSGYLWKNKSSVTEVIKKRTKTVLIPYAFFTLFYLIIYIFIVAVKLGLRDHSILRTLRAVAVYPTDMPNMPFAPALWFLPCFWLSNVLYAFFDKLCGKRKGVPIILVTVTGMAYSSLHDTMLPFCIEPVAVALFFMLVGETIKTNIKSASRWLEKWCYVIFCLLFEAILAIINGSCDMRSARYQNCLLYLLNAIIGTLGYWGLARKAIKTLPPVFRGGVEYLSINSIVFLCMNQFFILICNQITTLMTLGGLWRIVCKILTLLVTIFACTMTNEALRRSRFHLFLGR